MSKQVQTHTEASQLQQNTSLILRLHSQTESALERLASIIEGIGNKMYKQYKDPLSYQLMEWSANVMAVDLTDEVIGQKLFEKEVQDLLHVLKTSILVDFVAKSTLIGPILIPETGWTCEKQFIEWAQLGQTTYKGKPITLIPHEFAQQMLSWASSLTEEDSSSNAASSEAMPSSSNTSQLIQMASQGPQDANWESCMRSFLMTYKMKFQQLMAMFKLNQFMQDVYKESELLDSLLTLIDQRSKERVQKAQKQADKDYKILEGRIENMEKTNAEKVETLQASNADMRQRVEKAEVEVVNVKAKSLDQEAEISSLRYAYACRLQEIHALRASASRGGRRCTIL